MGLADSNNLNSQFVGPIFVIGAPRTGTTLTMEILNKHSAIHLYNEVHYNERIFDTMPDEGVLGPDALNSAVSQLLKISPWKKGQHDSGTDLHDLVKEAQNLSGRHSSIFKAFLAGEAQAHGKYIWGDSSPQDVLYIARLKQWYPDAKFIGVVRDPRGFLASYKNYYRKELKSYRNRFNPLANSLLWRSYMRALQVAKSSSIGNDIHIVSYEDLVSSPQQEIQHICSFLGISFEDSMTDVGRQNSSYFSVTEDKKQEGISAGSRDRWRTELSTTEIWLAQKICGVELRRLGYEAIPTQPGLQDIGPMLKIAFQLPGRMFNLLFRTGKPLTLAKLKRVLGKTK